MSEVKINASNNMVPSMIISSSTKKLTVSGIGVDCSISENRERAIQTQKPVGNQQRLLSFNAVHSSGTRSDR